MKQIKSFAILLLAVLTVVGCFSLSACVNDSPFSSAPSGQQYSLSESVLKIEQSLTPAKPKDGYVESLTVKANVKGYEELSYFNATVTVIWSYKFLNDSGIYEDATYEGVVVLNSTGKGAFEKTVKLNGCRNIIDIDARLVFNGFAVKK